MEGQNLSALAPKFVPFNGQLGSARQAWVLIAAVVMLPTVYLRNLALLAYLSAAGVLTSLSLTCLVGTIAGKHGKPSVFPYLELTHTILYHHILHISTDEIACWGISFVRGGVTCVSYREVVAPFPGSKTAATLE